MISRQRILNDVIKVRKASEAFLTDVCTIKRLIGETIDMGQSKPIYSEKTVACRFIVRSGTATTNLASQERATQQTVFIGIYRIQLEYDTDINENDKIVFQDVSTGINRTFEVIYVPPMNNMMGAFVITIQEMT